LYRITFDAAEFVDVSFREGSTKISECHLRAGAIVPGTAVDRSE
jgi:hypothetical protein